MIYFVFTSSEQWTALQNFGLVVEEIFGLLAVAVSSYCKNIILLATSTVLLHLLRNEGNISSLRTIIGINFNSFIHSNRKKKNHQSKASTFWVTQGPLLENWNKCMMQIFIFLEAVIGWFLPYKKSELNGNESPSKTCMAMSLLPQQYWPSNHHVILFVYAWLTSWCTGTAWKKES